MGRPDERRTYFNKMAKIAYANGEMHIALARLIAPIRGKH